MMQIPGLSMILEDQVINHLTIKMNKSLLFNLLCSALIYQRERERERKGKNKKLQGTFFKERKGERERERDSVLGEKRNRDMKKVQQTKNNTDMPPVP